MKKVDRAQTANKMLLESGGCAYEGIVPLHFHTLKLARRTAFEPGGNQRCRERIIKNKWANPRVTPKRMTAMLEIIPIIQPCIDHLCDAYVELM